MNRLILLMVAALLIAPIGVAACESAMVKAVVAASGAPVAIAISSLPEVTEGFSQLIELSEMPDLPGMREISACGMAMRAEGTGEPCAGGVVVTLAKALGKAVLKVIATVVQEIV
jgi:hypothetical protein